MQTAVITGAAQGLGLVTARLFADAGYRLVLTDVQPLDAVLADFTASGQAVLGLSGDISDEDFTTELAAMIARTCDGADVLVNNAGISMICPAEETTLEQWQRMMAINLAGPFLLCRDLGKQMLAKGKAQSSMWPRLQGLAG